MKTVTVYGPGCSKCKFTEDLVRRVVSESGIDAEVTKVSDLKEMLTAGIISTPAVAVDGVVKASGRIPKADEVAHWLAE